MADCMYCDPQDVRRLELMTPIAPLEASTLHFYREQTYPGRCVLVYHRHVHRLTELEPEAPDLPFGLGSGAAVIYGVTGGVAEAVVRYCLPDKSNNVLQAIRVTDLRGDGAIREVNLTVEGQELHIAIVNGLSHAKELIADVEAGKRFYHLVEVMTCQGGCVGGAGQPYGLTAAKKRRGAGLYEADATAMFKGAEKNPIVTRLLDEYGHERCHELLHVRYGE